MQNNLFGIYIPTFNRLEELEQALFAIIPQMAEYNYPIFISDQSTNYETQLLVKSLSQKYKHLHYRHSETAGYAKNVKEVFKMGVTEYAWLLGDDDIIHSDAIKKITSILNKRFDFVQINGEVFGSNFTKKIHKRIIDKYTDYEYESSEYEQALKITGQSLYAGFMGSMILKKEIINSELLRLDVEEENMDFIHTMVFFRGIKNKKGILIAEPLIMIRGGNWGYSKKIMEIYFISWNKACDSLRGEYTDYTIEEAKRMGLINLLIPITINKIANKSDAKEEYKRYIRDNASIDRKTKAILKIWSYTPKTFVICFYNIYTKIKGY